MSPVRRAPTAPVQRVAAPQPDGSTLLTLTATAAADTSPSNTGDPWLVRNPHHTGREPVTLVLSPIGPAWDALTEACVLPSVSWHQGPYGELSYDGEGGLVGGLAVEDARVSLGDDSLGGDQRLAVTLDLVLVGSVALLSVHVQVTARGVVAADNDDASA
jgi:hypothetical protein